MGIQIANIIFAGKLQEKKICINSTWKLLTL